jgi:hypothetical protein
VRVGSKLRPERHAAHLVRGTPTDGVAPKVGEPAHRGASKPQVSFAVQICIHNWSTLRWTLNPKP